MDNPSAFAAIATSPSGDVFHQDGMSLRDWFAGQALNGFLSGADTAQVMPEDIDRLIEIAFRAADAMLAQRNK